MGRNTEFKTNTTQGCEDITEAWKIAGLDPRKLDVRVGRVFVDLARLCVADTLYVQE